MIIEQIVEIPPNRRLTIDVPSDIPTGSVILTFTPKSEKLHWTPEPPLPRVHTLEEAIAQAEAQAARRRADPSIPLFNGMGGCLKDSKTFDGDSVAIQRELRNEWPD